jgi:hypothetical protein
MTTSDTSTLAIRVAHTDEERDVRRLADLDDAPPLDGQALIALLDGEAVAAMSLSDGRVVANPFIGTTDAITLLSLRASQLSRRRARRRLPLLPRLRLA